jgi:hypothetical protein
MRGQESVLDNYLVVWGYFRCNELKRERGHVSNQFNILLIIHIKT